jgi:hypothetical protein
MESKDRSGKSFHPAGNTPTASDSGYCAQDGPRERAWQIHHDLGWVVLGGAAPANVAGRGGTRCSGRNGDPASAMSVEQIEEGLMTRWRERWNPEAFDRRTRQYRELQRSRNGDSGRRALDEVEEHFALPRYSG